MRALLVLLLVTLPLAAAGGGTAYDGSSARCWQNGPVGGLPGASDCRVEHEGRVEIVDCAPHGCRYLTTGTATVRSDVPAMLEVSADVTTERDGAPWTCRSASAAPETARSCSGSVLAFATVAPGECVKLWATASGAVVLASSGALAPGSLAAQHARATSQFGSLCRDEMGAPSWR